MPNYRKKRQPHQAADRFYDYLMAHRSQVLRYAVAALVTGLLQFFISRLIPLDEGVLIAFGLRFVLLFVAAKYWVYREGGTGFFYTAKQIMLAIMIFVLLEMAITYLTIWLGNGLLISYVMLSVNEIGIFLIHQFLIFKEQD